MGICNGIFIWFKCTFCPYPILVVPEILMVFPPRVNPTDMGIYWGCLFLKHPCANRSIQTTKMLGVSKKSSKMVDSQSCNFNEQIANPWILLHTIF